MRKQIAGELLEINVDSQGGFTVHLIRRGRVLAGNLSDGFETYFLGRLTHPAQSVWCGDGAGAVRGVFAAPTEDAVIEQMVLAFRLQHPRPS
jgi:hypothetical protein